MKMKWLWACVLLVFALHAQARVGQVHRCTDAKGAMVLTDQGCEQDAQITAHRPFVQPQEVEPTPLPSSLQTAAPPTIRNAPQPAAVPAAHSPDGADRAAAAAVRRASGKSAAGNSDEDSSAAPADYSQPADDEPEMSQGTRLMLWSGLLLGFGGYFSLVVVAFQQSKTWGVLVLLFSPLAAVIFKITHKGKGRIPSIIGSIGMALAARAVALPSTDLHPMADQRPQVSATAPAASGQHGREQEADCARTASMAGVGCATGLE
ncbi:MAG TPA: hypothetical protein VHE37_11495 [Nevskiaceae bacterium]|nr:hypothetical protein [Nevskiaceae bacterium]